MILLDQNLIINYQKMMHVTYFLILFLEILNGHAPLKNE